MLAVARRISPAALPELFSLEVWGGATFDVALRFLSEDPWQRLAAAPRADPQRLPADAAARAQPARLRALSRPRWSGRSSPRRAPPGSTSSGSSTRSTTSSRCEPRSRRRSSAARSPRPRSATRATCPIRRSASTRSTTTSASPSSWWQAGAHILAIKDMAGLLRAAGGARRWLQALRREFELPVHLHTHDTAGGQLATYLAAIEAGVDAVDGAAAPLAGMTSQPALSGIVAATSAHRARGRRSRSTRCWTSSPTGTEVRATYAPFETGLLAPTGRVYRHEIPGGQLSNLRQQADGARPRRSLRGGGARLRARQRGPRRHRQGHPDEQGRRRPRAVRRLRETSTGRSSSATPSASTSRTRCSAILRGEPRASPRGVAAAVRDPGVARPSQRRTGHARRRRRSCPSSRARAAARRWPS